MQHFLLCMIPVYSPRHCRANIALRTILPGALKNGTFDQLLGVSLAQYVSCLGSIPPLLHLRQIECFNQVVTISSFLQAQDDPVTRNCLRQLLDNLAAPWAQAPQSGPGPTAGGAPHARPGSSQAGPSRVRR